MPACHWFIFKVASRCNLACKYCYMYFRGDESYRDRELFVSPEVVQALALRVRRYQERHALKQVHVTFHGGEPLLLGISRFRQYAQILTEVCGPSLTLSVQTNGLLLNDEWLALLSEFDVSVGISLDGPKAVNDRHRVFRGGTGTFEQVRRAIDMASAAGADGRIKFGGVIAVIDPDQDPRDFYNFMTRELGIRTFNVLLPDANHENYHQYVAHPPAMFGDFLTGLFDAWWNDAPERITIPFFLSLLRKLVIGRTISESVGAFTAPSIVVETDGAIQAHDVLRMNTPAHVYGGNVLTDEIDQIFTDSVYSAVNREANAETTSSKCKACPAFEVCQGGFVAHRFSNANGYVNPSVYCTALFQIVTHVHFALMAAEPSVREIVGA